MINILILTLIIVWIIDLSGILTSIENGLGKWLKCKVNIPKPFSCSLCMSWWCGLIYIIVIQDFTLLMIGYVALLSHLTPFFYNLLIVSREIMNKGLDLICKALSLE